MTLTHFITGADGRFQPVVENVCIEGAAQPGDYDYLRDRPFTP